MECLRKLESFGKFFRNQDAAPAIDDQRCNPTIGKKKGEETA